MELGLKGRTAIVCGSSSGIGLAIAESLAGEGANVAMFARRRDLLEQEAERLGALAVRGDVTNPADLERLVDRTLKAFGGVDILVNNSGGPPRTPAIGLTDEQVEEAVELLLLSAIRLTSLCLPELERSGHGRVINIESSSVREPIDSLALSNAVRPGVIGWAKTLAREVGPKKITINSPESVKGVQDAVDLVKSGAAKADVTSDSYNNMMKAFKDGTTAMIINGPWSVADIKTGEVARFEQGLKHTRLWRTKDGYFEGSNFASDPEVIKDENGEIVIAAIKL